MKILSRCLCALLGLILFLTMTPLPQANALSGAKDVTAVYGDLIVLINGERFYPYDARGNPDNLFSVDGVIYAPIYSITDKLGLTIHFDQPAMTMSVDQDVIGMMTVLQRLPDTNGVLTGVYTKKLDARFNNLRWKVNGKQLKFYDINGKVSEPFGVDGTIYAPIGLMSGNDGKAAAATGTETASSASAAVPASSIDKSLRKGMTDREFEQAYAIAKQITDKYAGMDRETQLKGIFRDVREITDTKIRYSTSEKHYNDVYGFYVLNVASCAGATRAVGLCLNILGIPYEHVNPNKWLHQWCRVDMGDGSYWICDPFGLTNCYEQVPYEHPLFGKG